MAVTAGAFEHSSTDTQNATPSQRRWARYAKAFRRAVTVSEFSSLELNRRSRSAVPLLLQLKQIVSSHLRFSFSSRRSVSSHVAKRAYFKEDRIPGVHVRAHSKEIWKMEGSTFLQLKQDRTLGVCGSFSSRKIGPWGSIFPSAEAGSDPGGLSLLEFKEDRTPGVHVSFS
jgi:hypothetical protein